MPSRSERSGLLHGWALVVQPAREQVEELASERQLEAGEAEDDDSDGEKAGNRAANADSDGRGRSRRNRSNRSQYERGDRR